MPRRFQIPALSFAFLNVASGTTFDLLGDLPGGAVQSSASALSASGETVVGRGEGASGTGAFVWTQATGIQLLPYPQASNQRAEATGLSDDATVIVGTARNAFNRDQAIRWVRQTDGSYTPSFLSIPTGSKWGNVVTCNLDASAISGDGTVIVGQGITTDPGAPFEAFYWTEAAGLTPMGNLSNGPIPGKTSGKPSFSSASAINRDGTIAAGRSWAEFTDDTLVQRPFRYSFSPAAMTALPSPVTPPNGGFPGADAISKDGKIIAGQERTDSAQPAFRHSIATGVTELLGDLPGGSEVATALGANADGSVIVGTGTTERGVEAFIWTPTLGLQLLETVAGLTPAQLGPDAYLESADAVSDDGLTIVGTHIVPDPVNNRPERQAYRLVLDSAALSPTAAELAMTANLAPSLTARELRLEFGFRPDLAFVWTIEFSPDLATPFAAMVSFTPDGTGGFTRTVLSTDYEGNPAPATLPLIAEKLPLATSVDRAFFRLKISPL